MTEYTAHEGGEPDGHKLTELAGLSRATLVGVAAFADAAGFSGDGLAIHWEGVGPIARKDHARCAQQVEDIRRYHTQQAGYADIAYNHLACVHGEIFEGRGWNRQSAATCNGTYNRKYWAICAMIGTGDEVTDALRSALASHWREAQRRGASSLICHRDACSTQCPGDDLCAWVHAGMPEGSQPQPQPEPVKPKHRSRHMIFKINDGEPGEAYQYVGGPCANRNSYIRLTGDAEVMINHDKGSPIVNVNKNEFQAFVAGKLDEGNIEGSARQFSF